MSKLNLEQVSALLQSKTSVRTESKIVKIRGTLTPSDKAVYDEVTQQYRSDMRACLTLHATTHDAAHLAKYKELESAMNEYCASKKRLVFRFDKKILVTPTAVRQKEGTFDKNGMITMDPFETDFFEIEQDMFKQEIVSIYSTSKEGVFDVEWDAGKYPVDSTNISRLPILRMLSTKAMSEQGKVLSVIRSYAERSLAYNRSLGNLTKI